MIGADVKLLQSSRTRRARIKFPLRLLAIVLLSFGCGGCGGAGKTGRRVFNASPGAEASSKIALEANNASTARYLNDGDHDIGGVKENSEYRDADDGPISFSYARVASPADALTITAIVKRYHAVAVADDGSRACSMLVPILVKAIPLDYGKFGPSYLRGAKTCQTIMSLIFKHDHNELSAPVAVTEVLVKGDQADALLGSTKIPASYMALLRVHGTWMIESAISREIL